MSGQSDHPAMVYLRQLDEKLDRLAGDLRDLKAGMSTIEMQIKGFAAAEALHYAGLDGRLG